MGNSINSDDEGGQKVARRSSAATLYLFIFSRAWLLRTLL